MLVVCFVLFCFVFFFVFVSVFVFCFFDGERKSGAF